MEFGKLTVASVEAQVKAGKGDTELLQMEDFRRCGHPLEIPYILNDIMEYLPFTDLQNCRLVCHQFDNEACRILKTKSVIEIKDPSQFHLEMTERLSISNANATSSLPFCDTFKLVATKIGDPQLTDFFNHYSHLIKTFEFRDCQWTTHVLADILSNSLNHIEGLLVRGSIPQNLRLNQTEDGSSRPIFPKLPKLKRLDLQLYDKFLADDTVLTQLGTDFLQMCSSVEVITNSESTVEGAEEWRGERRKERFQKILLKIMTSPGIHLPNLKNIDFCLTPSDNLQLEQLIAKNFPLEQLHLAITPHLPIPAVTKFLISLKSTLKRLKISLPSRGESSAGFDSGLQLDRLEELSIDGHVSDVFWSKCVNLRKLVLVHSDINSLFSDEGIEKVVDPLNYVTVLEILQPRLSGTSYVQSNAAVNISKVFPSVMTLTAEKLNEKSLRAIFTHFPSLQTFSAGGSANDRGRNGFFRCAN